MRDNRLHASAARAAASDYLDAAGLAAADIDPNRTGDIIAARARETLSADGLADDESSVETWARAYVGAMLGLQGATGRAA